MNIRSMLPSQIEAMKSWDWTDEKKRELLMAIKRLIDSDDKDNSGDQAPYLSACSLDTVGVFDKVISVEDFLSVITRPTAWAMNEFLEGSPPAFARKVYVELIKQATGKTKPSPKRMTIKEIEKALGHPVIISEP